MTDYPTYDVVVEREGLIPCRINSSAILNIDQAKQIIVDSGYTLPNMFHIKWNVMFGRGQENKHNQTWLEYECADQGLTLTIIRMWYNNHGECLCEDD